MSVISRSRPRVLIHVCVIGAGLLGAPRLTGAQQAATRGIVVEAVDPASAGGKSGLKPGDVLTSWERAPAPPADSAGARGSLASPFDLTEVEIEQAPRGTVSLLGRRGADPLRIVVPPGRWRVQARPVMSPLATDKYSSGRASSAAGRIDDAVAAWRELQGNVQNDLTSAWIKFEEAAVLRDAIRIDAAHAALREGLAIANRAGARAAIASLQEAQGQLYERQRDAGGAERSYRAAIATRQGDGPAGVGTAKGLMDLAFVSIGQRNFAAAEEPVKQAVDIYRRLAPDSFVLAKSLATLGSLVEARGDLDAAAPLMRSAADILERLVPGTADHAGVLNNLGAIAWGRGELVEATKLYERSLGIAQGFDASSPAVAATLTNLGAVTADRGRLSEAERLFRRALAIYEQRAPGSAEEATALNNLADLLSKRGDLSVAEDYFLRSLAIRERVSANSREVAASLLNIGLLSARRGDPVRAEDYLKRSLELEQRLAPNSLEVGMILNNLGLVAAERGDFASAETLLRQALAIKQRLAPDSALVASTLSNLGDNAESRGDWAAAREFYDAARVMLERAAPEALVLATVLSNLSDLADLRGDRAEADRLSARAVAMTEQVAPQSESHADALRRAGLQALKRKEFDRAATYLARSIDVLESITARLGGSGQVRTGFVGQRHDYYAQYIDTLIALGQPVRAFEVLERSRARGFRLMLAERDLTLDADLPPDLAEATRTLGEEYDRTLEALAELDPSRDAAEAERLRTRLRDLTESRARLADKVRAASPRLAALRYERPLDLSGIQQALDPGTVLLSYQIGGDASRLFVTGASRSGESLFAVHTVAAAEPALREQVSQLRRLIERQGNSREATPAFVELSRQLFDLLIGPARDVVARADRVLIVPDGPLHSLPFGALIRTGGESTARPWQYMVEWKPLHTALSATVYADLRKARASDPGPATLIAFGDPRYQGAADGAKTAGATQEPLRRGYALTPLPATRAEVEALARGFGGRATTYLGSDATEERAKSVKRTGYLHFATHGLLDARSPLDSALALTPPSQRRDGQENGLLQAWEIFEQVRIDADLVTLSACETALGKELAGEGLIGLTRAFHYAGARSVLASLWQVADGSTADMMTRFYEHLRAGATKDEALQRAQREAIADPKTSTPFHWAAFTLSGDWR